MIGHGINDAQDLETSDVGFFFGMGSGMAIESTDMALVHGGIRKVTWAIRVIKHNLFWAFGFNTITISVAVIVNSLRLIQK